MITGYGTMDHWDIPVNVYPNNEPRIMASDFFGNPSVLVLRPYTFTEFMAGLIFADRYRPTDLVIPLIPGARQDRHMPSGDVLPTLRYVCNLLNQTGITIHTFDPHSNVTVRNLDNIVVHHIPEMLLNANLSDFSSVIAPDEGAILRARRVASLIGVPLVVFKKKRDTSNGRITNYEIVDTSFYEKIGNRPLVVDDICDGGATFNILAQSLVGIDRQIAPALFVTHGLFTKGVDELLSNYMGIITTDSIPWHDPHPYVNVIDFTHHLARSLV